MKRQLAVALLLTVVLAAGTARAADDEPNSPRKQARHPHDDDEPDSPHAQVQQPGPRTPQTVAITFSPLALMSPVLEVTAEFRAAESTSFALVAGAGQIKQAGVSADLLELGGQVRAYPVGDFHNGLEIGLAAVYAHLSGTGQTSGVFDGLAAGPFAGFKLTAPSGPTLEGGLGLLVLLSDDGKGNSSPPVARVLLLNVGWSF